MGTRLLGGLEGWLGRLSPAVRWPSALTRPGVDGRDYRHTGAEFVGEAVGVVYYYFDGYSLYDLGEVACGVVRREQCKLGPGSGGKGHHVSTEGSSWERVYPYFGFLSGSHVRELCFL